MERRRRTEEEDGGWMWKEETYGGGLIMICNVVFAFCMPKKEAFSNYVKVYVSNSFLTKNNWNW
jgi:hypothetical protein